MKETQTPEANPQPDGSSSTVWMDWFRTFRAIILTQFEAITESLRGLHQAIADFREWSEARSKAVANANIETVQNLRAYLGNIETHILTHSTRADERLTKIEESLTALGKSAVSGITAATDYDDRNRERAQAMGETNAEHTKSILRAIGDVERRQLAHGKALTDLENEVLSLTNQPAEPVKTAGEQGIPVIPVRLILDGKLKTIYKRAGGMSPSEVREALEVDEDDVLMVRRRTVSTAFNEVDPSVDTPLLLEEGDQFITLAPSSAYRQRDTLLGK